MTDVYSKTTDTRTETDGTPHNKYPHNQTFQFAGGLRMIIGNEQGKETAKLFHPSGTYMEIFPDGKLATMVIGENKSMNKGGTSITIDENGDVHYSGHGKFTVGGGAHIEVQGDAGVVVGGKTAMVGLGDMGLSVNGNLLLTAKGNINMNASGNMNLQAKGTTYQGSGSTHTIQTTKLDLNPSDGSSGYTT